MDVTRTTLPVAPLALLMALIPAILLFAMAYWRFAIMRSYSLVPVIAFAVGVALVMLSAIVAATYAFQFHPVSPLRGSLLVLGIPAAGYVIALVVIGCKGQLSLDSLIMGGVVGLAPLCFLGFYAMLLSACSFGDCL